ncbi:MAG: hypothetical protein A2075_00565 [Geobacteraceae bacterium GWC2_58_44]|nr:MAG: hypothetical protein A2075_00565 [Geobacteraceae bacterium GWC2_58_44]HBG06452.1 MBOAT family protein [Geobacter sp.]
MGFSSPIFLFVFLPLVLAGYWLAGNRVRHLFLLAASLFFYAWDDARSVILLLASILVNYAFTLFIDRYREQKRTAQLLLCLAIVINLAGLAWYKYAGFAADSLNLLLAGLQLPPLQVAPHHLPLGISFFTFQAIAYLVDVHQQENLVQRNPLRFALFMSLFPKIAAGPIIRYSEVSAELAQPSLGLDSFCYGIKRFIVGLAKKVLIANTLAGTVDQIFAIPTADLPATVAWLGIICYTLQIYFDFSGYSDMAIGLGRMFGFSFQENFNYPYISRSLTEFWRRWHISLSTWLRDYLFTPLSYLLMTDKVRQKMAKGEYRTNYRTLVSLVVVFIICGFWHGAGGTFMVWGLFHGSLLTLESLWLGKALKRCWAPVQHGYLLFVVMLSWVLFRAPTLPQAAGYLKSMFVPAGGKELHYHVSMYLDNLVLLVIAVALVAMLPVTGRLRELAAALKLAGSKEAAATAALVLLFLVSLAFLAKSTHNPFIYQQF